jgi:hypothetical protein
MAATEPVDKDDSTAIRSGATTGLKKRSVILMIVLTFVTLGFYYPILPSSTSGSSSFI